MTIEQPLHCRIDDLVLDERTGKVTRGDVAIELPRLSFALLLELLRRAPAIVSSSELIASVWASAFVSDETVQQRVKLLRQALSDDPKNPRYIANVRGKGYRLIAEVECLAPEPTTTERVQELFGVGPHSSIARRWGLPLALLCTLVLAIFLYISTEVGQQHNGQFDNLSHHSANAEARDFYFNGKEYVNRGTDQDNEAAIIQFQQALALDPDYALAHAGLSHAYAARGMSFERGEQWLKAALTSAQKAVSLQPDYVETNMALAVAYHVQGMKEQAEASYRQVLQHQPEHHRSLHNLALLLRQRGKINESLLYSLRAVTVEPRQHSGYQRTAELFFKIGMPDHAVAWYQKALMVAPQNQQLHYQLCSLHISMGDLDAANASCADMVSWAPQDSWGYEWVGELELLNGNREKARLLYQQAMELGSNYSLFRYASFLYQDGELDLAQPLLDESLQVMLDYQESSPGNSGAMLNLVDYYGALGDEQQVYYWLHQLLETDYSNVGYFTNNSCLSTIKHQPDFQQIMQQLANKQEQLRQSVNPGLLLLPEQVNKASLFSIALDNPEQP